MQQLDALNEVLLSFRGLRGHRERGRAQASAQRRRGHGGHFVSGFVVPFMRVRSRKEQEQVGNG
jgi:hypothetical protein